MDTNVISEQMEAAKARLGRLKEIEKELKQVRKQKDALQKQEDALLAEAGIDSGENQTKSKGKRGRPKGSTNKTSKAKSESSPRGRASSETGETRTEILYRVLPSSEEDPIDKDEMVKRVEDAGFKTTSDDPKVGLSQDLSKMAAKKHVTNKEGERGEWRLTKLGEKQRDKIAEEKAASAEAEAEAEAEATEQSDNEQNEAA